MHICLFMYSYTWPAPCKDCAFVFTDTLRPCRHDFPFRVGAELILCSHLLAVCLQVLGLAATFYSHTREL